MTKNTKPFFAFFLFLFAISFFCFGQDEYDTVVVQDLESWNSATFELKLNKKFNLQFSEELRLQENSSKIERFFSELKLNYKLHKNFQLGLGYRFFTENKRSGYQNGHRWNIDTKYKFDIERFNGYARLRYQSAKEFNSDDNPENHLRMKVKLKYDIKNWKIDPYISAELFGLTGKEACNQFDKMRFTTGSSYKFNKMHSVSFFYGIEKELNTNYPKTIFLIGLGYKFTFKLSTNEK